MYAFFASVGFFWFFIMFCDTIFKTCMFHPYFRLLQISGLNIRPLSINVCITRYNRLINRMGQWKPLLLRRWFNVGAFITSLIVGPSIILYLISLCQIYKSSSMSDYDNSLLLPVIPGYNFPVSHWMYYVTIILICSVVHEFGHALAASREHISIEECGFALLAVFPLAYVNVRFDQFRQISLWQQLRILCAGIWHNIVLSLLAALLHMCAFYIFSSLYYTGKGVSVLEIHQKSSLNGPAGFEVGDHIYGIGDCSVKNREIFQKCLQQLSENELKGFCVPENFQFINNSMDRKNCINSAEYLYFQAPEFESQLGICLHARQVVEKFIACNRSSECKKSFLCVFPVMSTELNRLIVLKRHHKPPVLYEGSVKELFAEVLVSDFVSKFQILPASYAEMFMMFLEYVIMFSSGLAVLNMLPVLALDGQYITENLVHLCLQNYVPRYADRRCIFLIINRIGIGILISLVILSASKIIFSFYI